MYKLSAVEIEEISFALVKGPTHYCSQCGQMFPEDALQDVWVRGKGFYGGSYSFRYPLCNTCLDFLQEVEGSIKKEKQGELYFKSAEELEDLFFLLEGCKAHNA